MEPFPPLPPLSAGGLSGHLWLQELVVGEPLRFGIDADGRVAVADTDGRLEEPPAPSLRASVRFVRERLDRPALQEAAADPTEVTFYGVATRFEGVPYDFERLPPFVGTDVHDGTSYLPPDRVAQAFDRLGLAAVNTFDREVEATHFDPAAYDPPGSEWYDGPPAGVVFRSKGGERAVRRSPTLNREVEPLPSAPAAAAAATTTSRRVRRALALAPADDPGFDAVFERTLELLYREEHARIPDEFDHREFRSAVADRVGELR